MVKWQETDAETLFNYDLSSWAFKERWLNSNYLLFSEKHLPTVYLRGV